MRGRQSLEFCIVSSFKSFMDEKNQMKAPSTRAYFTMQTTPPSNLLRNPMTGKWFINEETKEPTRFATIGTMTHSSTNAITLQRAGIDRKTASTSANSW